MYYRGLNKLAVKNRYPLLQMSELCDRVKIAKIFTKLDIKDGYYLIRVGEGDEWETAFRTDYGLYQYMVADDF